MYQTPARARELCNHTNPDIERWCWRTVDKVTCWRHEGAWGGHTEKNGLWSAEHAIITTSTTTKTGETANVNWAKPIQCGLFWGKNNYERKRTNCNRWFDGKYANGFSLTCFVVWTVELRSTEGIWGGRSRSRLTMAMRIVSFMLRDGLGLRIDYGLAWNANVALYGFAIPFRFGLCQEYAIRLH